MIKHVQRKITASVRLSLLEMVVSSPARSLVLLFYYNKWGYVIFYNP